MKNKILILVIVILLLATSIYLLFFRKNSNNNDKKESKTVDITNLYDEEESIKWSDYENSEITLSDSIKITEGGVYTLTGTISDGHILIDTEDEVKLILDNVSITSSNSPAIIIENVSLVEIELKDGSENYLEDGSSYLSGYADYEGVIYSKDDLILSGTGSLIVKSNSGDAIVSKDNLKIVNGTYIINSKDDAIKGKDSVYILDGNFDITSMGDAVKATNDSDAELGYVYITGGNFKISSKDDGITSITKLVIDGGTIDIEAVEGLESTYVVINGGNISIEASDDGINAAEKTTSYTPTVEINGGNITIVMGSGDTDGIDANGYLYINGGTINITGNSPFDYDIDAKYTGGTMIVNGEETQTITNQFANGGPGGGQVGPGGEPNQGNPGQGEMQRPQRNGGRY